MKTKLFLLAISLISMLSCTDNSPDPDPTKVSLIGWVSGVLNEKGIIAKTIDGGQTWQYQNVPDNHSDFSGILALSDDICWTIGIDKEKGNIGHLFKTTDGGKTWVKKAEDITFEAQKFGIASIDGIDIWISGNDYIYHSNDGGEKWTKEKFDCIYPFEVEHITTSDGKNIYVCGGIKKNIDDDVEIETPSIYYTNNKGKNWNTMIFPTNVIGTIIDISSYKDSIVYAVGQKGFAIKSTNNFKHFETFTDLQNTECDNNGVYCIDENKVIVGADYGEIFYTNNGGKTWQLANIPNDATGHAVMRLQLLGDQKRGVATLSSLSSESGFLISTTDGGKNWIKAKGDIMGNFTEVSFVQSRRK